MDLLPPAAARASASMESWAKLGNLLREERFALYTSGSYTEESYERYSEAIVNAEHQLTHQYLLMKGAVLRG